MKFTERINIPASQTLAMNSAAAQKRAQGHTVFNLTTGEPQVPLDAHIIQSANEAMQAGKNFYTPQTGIPTLREAFCGWVNARYEANLQVDQVCVTNGGKFALYGLLQVLIEQNQEVLIVSPYWVSYPATVKLAGGKAAFIQTSPEEGFKLTASKLEKSITQNTKVLILNSGGNPTGALYTREELESLLKICQQKNILVISDEVYSELVYDGKSYASCFSFSEYRDNVIGVQSMSKNFAMSGWRVGYVFGNEDIVSAMVKLQSQSTSGTCSIAQWASVSAIENAENINASIKKQLQQRRDFFADQFEKHFGRQIERPKSGLYFFLPLSDFGEDGTSSFEFCMDALEHANVAMVPGSAFGCEGYVRCSFGGKEEEIGQALSSLAAYLPQKQG